MSYRVWTVASSVSLIKRMEIGGITLNLNQGFKLVFVFASHLTMMNCWCVTVSTKSHNKVTLSRLAVFFIYLHFSLQDGVNWLAFLNRYKLHGILCDGILCKKCHFLHGGFCLENLAFYKQILKHTKKWAHCTSITQWKDAFIELHYATLHLIKADTKTSFRCHLMFLQLFWH